MSINEYKLEEQIGSGSFGDVYRGIEKRSGLKVAIKRLRKKVLYESGKYLLKAFYREIECMKKCECDNSVKLIKEFQTQNNYNIIMELCDTDLLCHLYERKNPFTAEEIRDIFSQLNNAFRKMTQNNILHRDLKLGNILIKFTDESKTKFIPKLTDYGFSKELNKYNFSSCTHLGTPATMAPEIMMNNPYNKKSDLWSIGVMMYQLYFREVPYEGNTEKEILEKIKSHIPYKQPKEEDLRDLINKLLVFNVEDRLSWNEYFNHQFFNQKNNKNNNYNSNRHNYNYGSRKSDVSYYNSHNIINNNNNNYNDNNDPNNCNCNSNISNLSNSFSFIEKCNSFNKEIINEMDKKEMGYSCNFQIFDDNKNNNNNDIIIDGNIYSSKNDIYGSESTNYKSSCFTSGNIFYYENKEKNNSKIELIDKGKLINDHEYQIITKCCSEVIDSFIYPFALHCVKKIENQLNGKWFVFVFTEKDYNYDFFLTMFIDERFLVFKYKDNIVQICQFQ